MQTEFARAQMITQQVRAWDVLDPRVLDAMRRTPREFFVPERYAGIAFADADIPLAPGQHMLAPKIVGRLLQALAAAPGMRGLVVGCGTGFVPACLSAMGASVRAIEIRPELAQAAQRNLKRAGFGQVDVVAGDSFNLDIGQGYALIAVCGALPLYDDRFARALAVGGRLFVVVGASLPQEALLVTRTAEQTWSSEGLFETAIDPLEHAAWPERFQF
ncbi:MAG TPA: protein-L-isoaspartate O-methyltransferase [Steroidobacteraceae bacterium]|nr:protein-L-isoaspartate O-methyltransferase [Steroidobacteraceae bacterium]